MRRGHSVRGGCGARESPRLGHGTTRSRAWAVVAWAVVVASLGVWWWLARAPDASVRSPSARGVLDGRKRSAPQVTPDAVGSRLEELFSAPPQVEPLPGPVAGRVTTRFVQRDVAAPLQAFERSVSLAPDGRSVVAQVVDENGLPVPGARVVLYRDIWGHHGGHDIALLGRSRTDGTGWFRILATRGRVDFDLSAAWRLSVRAPGHAPFLGRVVVVGAADRIVLDSQTVYGKLRFDDGTPVSGAALRFAHRDFEATGPAGEPDRALVESQWELGMSAEDGSFALQVPAGMDPLPLAIEHELHESTRLIPAAAWTEHGSVMLVLQRTGSLTLSLRDGFDAWRARGAVPYVVLDPLDEQADGSFAPRPDPDLGELSWLGAGGGSGWFRAGVRAPDGVAHFPRLDEQRVRVRLVCPWGGDDIILFDEVRIEPKGTSLSAALPPPPVFEIGDEWSLPVRVVNGSGAALDSEAWSKLWRTALVVTDAEGERDEYQLPGDGSGRTLELDLLPPVSVALEGFASLARVDDLSPGDTAVLIWDDERRQHGGAQVRLDLDEFEWPGHERVLFSLRRGARGAWTRVPPVVEGLPPGSWEYRFLGPGLRPERGTFELEPGDRHVIPVELAPSGIDGAGEHDPELQTGRVRLVGSPDPWVDVRTVRFVPVSGGEALEAAPRKGAFRARLPPGRYRVEVVLERTVAPEVAHADNHLIARDEGWALPVDIEPWDTGRVLDVPADTDGPIALDVDVSGLSRVWVAVRIGEHEAALDPSGGAVAGLPQDLAEEPLRVRFAHRGQGASAGSGDVELSVWLHDWDTKAASFVLAPRAWVCSVSLGDDSAPTLAHVIQLPVDGNSDGNVQGDGGAGDLELTFHFERPAGDR